MSETLRLTLRVRLTLWYGGMFFLAGAAMLLVTYLLVERALEHQAPPEGAVMVRDSVDGDKFTPNELRDLEDQVVRREVQLYENTLNEVLTQGGIALGGVGVIAIGFGWLMAERVLRPLHRITDTARRVADSHLHERIGLTGPKDELKELADTFDAMLERLDRGFAAQRRFVANASHELRTPLAINRTLLEVAMSHPAASADLLQTGGTLLVVNARHERLIDGLLTLARTEHELTERTWVDLAEITGRVVEQARREAADAGVAVRSELRVAPTSGEPVLLERLVQNLVQNGIRHNHPDGWVSVSTYRTRDQVEFVVENTGPVVPGYEADGLFEPFRRLSGRERVHSDRGVGLGLSIVRAVTRAHGGHVTAEPRDAGGLRVRVTLPLATPQPTLTGAAAGSGSDLPAGVAPGPHLEVKPVRG